MVGSVPVDDCPCCSSCAGPDILAKASGCITAFWDQAQAIERNAPDHSILESDDDQVAMLHIFSGDVDQAFQLLKTRIESAEQIANDPAKSRIERTVESKLTLVNSSMVMERMAETLAEALPAQEAKVQLDRLLEWSNRLPADQRNDVESRLAMVLAGIGEEAMAARLFQALEELLPQKAPGDEELARMIELSEQWNTRLRKHAVWEARLEGWQALAQFLHDRKDKTRTVLALDELERLIRNPAPVAGPIPTSEELLGDPGPAPGVGGNDNPVSNPRIDSEYWAWHMDKAVRVMAELGESDRALALNKLLPRWKQLPGLISIADAVERSGQQGRAAELRRQALATARQSLAELEAQPIPNAEGKPQQADTPERPEEAGIPPSQRDEVRARLMGGMSELQASLGEFEAASKSALAVSPLVAEQYRVRGVVLYWMARKGRAREALDQALTLDALEPQFWAVVTVAQACGEVLAERPKK